jgi:hypothetical protein
LPKHIFISYSQNDKKWAEMVCAQLEEAGIGCWIAPRDIAPGVTWPAAITDAIRQCRAMIIIFSTHANQSPHMAREVEVADNRRVPILPVRVEDIAPAGDMEYFLSNRQWYDLHGATVERKVTGLPEVISSLLADASGAAPAAHAAPPGITAASGGAQARRTGGSRTAVWVAAGAAGVLVLGAVIWYAVRPQSARVSLPVKQPPVYVAQEPPAGERKAANPVVERRREAREARKERKEELARSEAPEPPAAAPGAAAPVPAAAAPPPAAMAPNAEGFAGRWRAQVKYSWGDSHNEVFNFKVDQNEVFGTATYVGGARGVLDGRIEGNRITFTTKSQTLLGDKRYEEKHQYRGRLSGNTIEFILQTDSGYDSRPPEMFTATRVEPGSPEPSR